LISPDPGSCSGLRPHFPQIPRPDVDPSVWSDRYCGLLTLAIIDSIRQATSLTNFRPDARSRLLGRTPRAPTSAAASAEFSQRCEPAFSPARPILIGHNGHGGGNQRLRAR
jgi:hypothetical protein